MVKYTEGDKTYVVMHEVAKGLDRWYKRLNVSTGLGKIQLDESFSPKRAGE